MPENVKPTRRVRRLSHAIGEGVKDLPTNASWLLAKAVGPLDPRSVTSSSGLADAARAAGATVMDALPIGDSIELRLQRARAAAAEAQEAEDDAVQQSLEAERLAQEAEDVAQRCDDFVRDVEAEQARMVDQRVEEARREARALADRALDDARAEAEGRAEEARREAETAHERARASLEEARDKLVEARTLAEEAMEVTRAAAEEAHRQALQVATEAERDVAEAERVRDSASDTAKEMTRQLNGSGGSSGLRTMTKQELLDLATAQGIEGRSGMTKSELVTALGKASRKGGARTKAGAAS